MIENVPLIQEMDDILVTDADSFLRGRIREASKEFKSKQIRALENLEMW